MKSLLLCLILVSSQSFSKEIVEDVQEGIFEAILSNDLDVHPLRYIRQDGKLIFKDRPKDFTYKEGTRVFIDMKLTASGSNNGWYIILVDNDSELVVHFLDSRFYNVIQQVTLLEELNLKDQNQKDIKILKGEKGEVRNVSTDGSKVIRFKTSAGLLVDHTVRADSPIKFFSNPLKVERTKEGDKEFGKPKKEEIFAENKFEIHYYQAKLLAQIKNPNAEVFLSDNMSLEPKTLTNIDIKKFVLRTKFMNTPEQIEVFGYVTVYRKEGLSHYFITSIGENNRPALISILDFDQNSYVWRVNEQTLVDKVVKTVNEINEKLDDKYVRPQEPLPKNPTFIQFLLEDGTETTYMYISNDDNNFVVRDTNRGETLTLPIGSFKILFSKYFIKEENTFPFNSKVGIYGLSNDEDSGKHFYLTKSGFVPTEYFSSNPKLKPAEPTIREREERDSGQAQSLSFTGKYVPESILKSIVERNIDDDSNLLKNSFVPEDLKKATCKNFDKLSNSQKKTYWANFFDVLAEYESSHRYGLVSPIEEIYTSVKNSDGTRSRRLARDKITKYPIISLGLIQVSYQDQIYYGCNFEWQKDKSKWNVKTGAHELWTVKSNVSPRSITILDPQNNLQCGITILESLLATWKKQTDANEKQCPQSRHGRGTRKFFSSCSYWSPLHPASSRNEKFKDDVVEELKSLKACGN